MRSQVSQKAAENVVKQGGSKDEANRAAQAAAGAAVSAVNAAQKQGNSSNLAKVASTAAAPVVDAFAKDKDAKVRRGVFFGAALAASEFGDHHLLVQVAHIFDGCVNRPEL
jgi:hypothetical protein